MSVKAESIEPVDTREKSPSESTTKSSNGVFRPGTNVLAYHGPLVYEARVVKYREAGSETVDIADGKSEPSCMNKIPGFLLDQHAYFLHYKGWNPKWDEWVSAERIMEFNDNNLGLSRELRNARKKPIERLDPGVDLRPSSKEKKARKMKKKETGAVEKPPKETAKMAAVRRKVRHEKAPTYEVMLPLRPRLKCILVDDWELITKDHKLVDLKTTTPVTTILDEYYTWKSELLDQTLLRVTQEALVGLKAYFDRCLSLDLLYRYERLQYSDLLLESSEPASLTYGVEHLLRLLSTLPARVAQTTMDAPSLGVLMGQVKALLEYLDSNMERLASSYMNSSPQYDRIARG